MGVLKKINILLLCVQFSQVLAQNSVGSPRVLGGVTATQPFYQVFIADRNGENHCSGALIHPEWVLTSADCAERFSFSWSNTRVSTGVNQVTNAKTSIQFTKRVIKHPNYNPFTLANDLALININTAPVQDTDIIPLPAVPVSNYYNKKAVISGWGETAQGTPATGLTSTPQRIVNNAQCHNIKYPTPFAYKICTYGRSICEGDQGAPLIHNDELIGIASASSNAMNCGQAENSQFTNVGMYLRWIRQYVPTPYEY